MGKREQWDQQHMGTFSLGYFILGIQIDFSPLSFLTVDEGPPTMGKILSMSIPFFEAHLQLYFGFI
jgi:hypothetical protein